MSGIDIALGLLTVVTLAAALAVAVSVRLVRAASYLVVVLLAVAVSYLLLHQEFVGLVQVLVYVGAIVVLLIIALMLTRAPAAPAPAMSQRGLPRWAAALIATGFGGALAAALVTSSGGWSATSVIKPLDTAALAHDLFSTWVVPFEALSLLLLVALVIALTLTGAARRSR